MTAAGTPGKLTITPNHEPSLAARIEGLLGGEAEFEYEHPVIVGP